MFKYFTIAFSALLALSSTNLASASVGVHCGTTDDATFSDCEALVQQGNWNAAWAGRSNVCHYTNPFRTEFGKDAYNVACRGNCCVYVAGYGDYYPDGDAIRNQAAGLLGCADRRSNKINALQTFSDGHGVCLSNGNGCGDCFDDSDFIAS